MHWIALYPVDSVIHFSNNRGQDGCRTQDGRMTYKNCRARPGMHSFSSFCRPESYHRLVQSLNSPFFPPHIGAEPGQAKEESRITCMGMPRTNQSKITRSQPRRSRQCVAMPFPARALKENVFFGVDIVVKNIKT